MIRFFRTIRQNLLAQGRITRYLTYAFGEIVLVVIGILVALQLNLWKEERNQRIQEIQTLEQLRDEFTSNLMQLDEKISMRKAMVNAGLQLLAYHDDRSLIVSDSVEIFLARTTVAPTFDPITNDLISSGRLYLITNLDLRRSLSGWSSELAQVTEEEQAWIVILRQTYVHFLRERYPTRNINARKWDGLDVVNTLLLDKTRSVDARIHRSRKEPDLQALFTDTGFEDQLSSVVSAAMFANVQSMALRKSILGILELIDAELKNN